MSVPGLVEGSGAAIHFCSPAYLVFLITVFVGFWLLAGRPGPRHFLLLAASYFFYASWSPFYLILIWFSSSLDFLNGQRMSRTNDPVERKRLLWTSISINMGLLAIFKYANFAASTASSWGIPGLPADGFGIIVPAGISFYTFQTMSYIIDRYRNDTPPARSYQEYLLYVAFFPQLVAGPIVRAKDFLPQFLRPPTWTRRTMAVSVGLILCGSFKKLILADNLGLSLVDRVFDQPELYSATETLAAIYGYAFQIYCDFSGYSDIAIGSALLLGFTIPKNFDRPYLAVNLRDFWRRWHISLSTWFRDYLYIPLGGNRAARWRVWFNLWLVMLLCGLWHGADWKFVVWGAMHGVGLMVVRWWHARRKRVGGDEESQVPRWKLFIAGLATFHFVCLAWVFFRADDLGSAWRVLTRLWSNEWIAPNLTGQVLILLALASAMHFTPPRLREILFGGFEKLTAVGQAFVIASFLTFLYLAASAAGSPPFIYFQF